MASEDKISQIYSRLLEILPLSDQDKAHLMTERGLPEELIEDWRFRSAGKHVTEYVNQLQQEFSDSELVEASILHPENGALLIDSSLLSERIIIPYRMEQGISNLRPHKLGLKGVAPQVFCQYLLKDRPKKVIITEGEFKTLALHCMGFDSIALPGVSSFSSQYLSRLVEMLQRFGVEEVIISFDNDEKDNPARKEKFKAPWDRYDTQFYAYVMARKLGESGIDAKIADLPNEWRIDGKADIDSAWVKLGKTREDFVKVFAAAQEPLEYLNNLPELAKKIVRRKVAAWKARVPVRRSLGRYLATRSVKDATYDEAISNFVIDIKHIYESDGEVLRLVEFVNEYGERSAPFILNPDEMSGETFKRFCFSKGNYLFKGGPKDLNHVWEYEFLNSPAQHIILPPTIGEIEPGVWLFGNCVIHNGKVFEPDDEGIIWVERQIGDDVEQIGYKPRSLAIDVNGDEVERSFPTLNLERKMDLQEVGEKLAHTVGDMEAYVGISWVISSLFSREIFRKYRMFPFLFVRGKKDSGKTTFLQWLMSFFGIDSEGINIGHSSEVSLTRVLGYYSSLGVWLDEYRNEHTVTKKNGLLRSAYNRQSVGKGIKAAFGTRSYPVRSTLALSGQESPSDAGLYSRLVMLQLTPNHPNKYYDWIKENAVDFSAVTRDILLQYDIFCPMIIQNIQNIQNFFEKKKMRTRTVINWSVVLGACITFFPEKQEAVYEWICSQDDLLDLEAGNSSELTEFFNILAVGVLEGHIGEDMILLEGDTLYIWMTGAYGKFAQLYRQQYNRAPFDRPTIASYLKGERWYAGSSTKRLGGGVGSARSCVTIDVTKVSDPAVLELVESLRRGGSEKQPEF